MSPESKNSNKLLELLATLRKLLFILTPIDMITDLMLAVEHFKNPSHTWWAVLTILFFLVSLVPLLFILFVWITERKSITEELTVWKQLEGIVVP